VSKLAKQLEDLDACREARHWVGSKTLVTAWKTCKRGDWLLWLAARAGVDQRLVVEAACRCAEAVIGLVPEGEHRPIRAIETARAWIHGDASLEKVRSAADEASEEGDVFHSLHDQEACAAAYAAAYAAYAAAFAADAAYAAATATTEDALSDCADLVRQVITAADVAKALKGAP
jgi:hypothetical protein